MRTHNRLGLLLVVALASSSVTTAAASKRPISFTGDCQGSGVVRFDPALTNTAQPITQHARGVLTCSGSLVDRRGRTHDLNNVHVGYRSTEQGDAVSCGLGIDSGPGVLRFHRWGALRFTVSEKRAAAAATLTYAGAKGGSATGVAHPTDDPAATVQACAGSGLERAHVDLMLSADSLSG